MYDVKAVLFCFTCFDDYYYFNWSAHIFKFKDTANFSKKKKSWIKRRIILLLGFVDLLSNFVRYNLLPIDFAPGDGQLATKSFESRIRHGLVIFINSQLVFRFRLFNQANNFLGRLRFILYINWKIISLSFELEFRMNQLTVDVRECLTFLEHTSWTLPSS